MPFFGSNSHTKASFVLEWITDERFVLREQFRYRYEKTGDIFIVPREIGRFSTDFASVPSFATWLVPRVGNHAPAAVPAPAAARQDTRNAGPPRLRHRRLMGEPGAKRTAQTYPRPGRH